VFIDILLTGSWKYTW